MTYYAVEEGIYSPRDNRAVFRPFGEYGKIKEARDASSNLTYYRILKVQVIDERNVIHESPVK